MLNYCHGGDAGSADEFEATYRRCREMLPDATLGKPVVNDRTGSIDVEKLARLLASARVGLCLSTAEGAKFVSIDYLMDGLPVVSPKSKGGRDHYFHEDYCMIMPDDPRAIREAVAAMVARNIPAILCACVHWPKSIAIGKTSLPSSNSSRRSRGGRS